MIRRLQKLDINKIADIWLDTNMKAHNFIPTQYWTDNYKTVKESIEQAEVYVYEDGNNVLGFVGLSEDYIAGIFVSEEAQSRGVGKQLLDFVKGIKKQLRLTVYQKNTRAVTFYQREQFEIQHEQMDTNTGEKEYVMIWNG